MNKSINMLWYLGFFLVFPALFYKQTLGINVMFYVALLIVFWVIVFGQKARTRSGLIWLTANIIAASSVAIYGSTLSTLSLIAVVSTTAVFFNQNNVNPVSSIVASLKTFILMPFRLNKSINLPEKRKIQPAQIFLYIILPSSILVGFAILYSMSDILFADLLSNIDLDIFKIQFFITMFLGLIIIFSIAHARVGKKRARLEHLSGRSVGKKDRFPIQLIPREFEQTTGIITLFLLNILILLVIVTDVRYRILGDALPAGISHSAYLHQGIIALIISIVCAILMLTWLYRMKGNEHPILKTLSIAWLAQNMVLVALNVARNSHYIAEYSLTYKRIGVFFYLLLAMAGLAYTILFVHKRYNFLYLVKLNSYTALFVLVMASPIPWDTIITHYNTDQAMSQNKRLDLRYITSLPNADLHYLFQNRDDALEADQFYDLSYAISRRVRKESDKKLLSKTLYKTHQIKLHHETFDE